jgi:heme-degrading monooxygenase HmoA
MKSRFAPRAQPPYWAVIFTNQRTDDDADGDAAMAELMAALAERQPGDLGAESTRDASGLGITVSYWRSEDDIHAWRRHVEHAAARDNGRARWYRHDELRVARVERAYGWDVADGAAPPAGTGWDLA